MHKLSGKNCLISGCTVSCLSLFLLFVSLYYLFLRFDFMSFLEDRIDSLGIANVTRSSHLEPRDKNILLKVGLIADSENDWVYMKLALNELESRGVTDAFHLGDITSLGVPSDLLIAKDYFEKSGIKVYPIPGDRDLWKSRGIEAFENTFGASYGAFDISGVKFLVIDNSDEYEGIDDTQYSFIKENIAGSKFVLLHNPVYFGVRSLWGKGMGEYSETVDEQRKSLLKIIRDSTSVNAVFAGDQHLFSENSDEDRKDLMYYIIGSISSERNIERPNFAILTVYDDGDYYVEKVSL